MLNTVYLLLFLLKRTACLLIESGILQSSFKILHSEEVLPIHALLENFTRLVLNQYQSWDQEPELIGSK